MSVAPQFLIEKLRPRSRVGWIGVDIGTHSVKVAQLRIVNGRKLINEATVVPYPDDARLTADSLKTGWLSRILKAEIARHRGFLGRTAACCVSMSVQELRSLNIPQGSNEERRLMIAQELMESADQAGDQIEFDFWDGFDDQSDPADAPPLTNVLSISSGLAQAVGESFEKAGLHCRILDGAPFALARTVGLAEGNDVMARAVAVLDWGHCTAHFAVIINGQPAFSRVLKDCGAGRCTSAVAKGLGISPIDCHHLLSTIGVPGPVDASRADADIQELLADLSNDAFSQLQAELHKTLAFLRTQRPGLVPSHIWLVGGGATIRNVDTKLASEMGLSINRWQLDSHASHLGIAGGDHVELLGQAASLSELRWQS